MTQREARLASFLLVEDDEIDATAFCRALEKRGMTNPVKIASNGREALELLREADALISPFIVLLDLNTPHMDGHEFLAELRADAQLASTVVFVLSSSDAAEDRRRAYDHNIAGYLIKPTATQGFEPLLAMLDAYWRTVELPG